MVDTARELQRVTEHLDKVSDVCRMLRTKPINTERQLEVIEDALFNILLALRLETAIIETLGEGK